MSQAAGGGDRPQDGSAAVSRPSKNNRQAWRERPSHENLEVGPSDLPHAGLRPLSVQPDRRLRDEAVLETSAATKARPWYSVVSEWRDWYDGYLGAHIEFETEDGEKARAPLENSYMPSYGKRYYAKLKDFERGVAREFEGMTTVMLTLTASHRNANGGWRCPADHMRDIMEGYDAARKQLHNVLSGRNWEYARVWEPHGDGYGHLHIAVFVEDDDGKRELRASDFERVMRSHVENCGPAGWEAHQNTPCEEHAGEGATAWEAADSGCDDCDVAASVNDNVENLGSYVSEYIGIFGEETLQRPMKEQMFYATCWATNTRRVDFSNGAHDVMNREQFRRETGLRPQDRGGQDSEEFEEWTEADVVNETGGEEPKNWDVSSICSVTGKRPQYSDPTTGGVDTTAIDGQEGVDPPKEMGGPPPK